MTDPTDIEIEAMEHASAMAGELLESYTSTDVADWVPEQWYEFIRVTCGGYVDYLVTRNSEAAEAMGKVAGTLP